MSATQANAAERWESVQLAPLIEPSLVIFQDGSYEYTNYAGGCWVMWNDRGKWREDGDGLVILESENQIEAQRLTVISSNDYSFKGIRITVVEARSKPISGADVQIGDGSIHKFTDARGVAEFTAADLTDVVGSREWLAVVSHLGTGFVRIPQPQNSHEIRVVNGAPRPRRSYFAHVGGSLKDLNGLRITFDRCPEEP